MGYSSVHEHLQTLWGGCKVKERRLRLTNRPAPPELFGRSVCSAPPKAHAKLWSVRIKCAQNFGHYLCVWAYLMEVIYRCKFFESRDEEFFIFIPLLGKTVILTRWHKQTWQKLYNIDFLNPVNAYSASRQNGCLCLHQSNQTNHVPIIDAL